MGVQVTDGVEGGESGVPVAEVAMKRSNTRPSIIMRRFSVAAVLEAVVAEVEVAVVSAGVVSALMVRKRWQGRGG